MVVKQNFFGEKDQSVAQYRNGRTESEKGAQIAEDNYTLFLNVNNSERQKWAYDCYENFQFYKGIQLTREEKKAYKEQGIASFIINMITPAIEIMKYFITANKPMWKYSAVESSDTNAVDVFRALADYCYTKSNGHLKLSKVVLDALTRSIGYMHIYKDGNADRGNGEVVFDYLDFENVLIDPASKDPFARDANYIIIAKNISRTGLINKLPQYKDKIENASYNESIVTTYRPNFEDEEEYFEKMDYAFDPRDGKEEDFIPYFEVYRKEKALFHNIKMRVVLDEQQIKEIEAKHEKLMQKKAMELDVFFAEKMQTLTNRLTDEQNPIIQKRFDYEKMIAEEERDSALASYAEELNTLKQKELYPIKNIQIADAEFKELKKKDIGFEDDIVEHGLYYENRIKVSVTLGTDTFLYEDVLPVKNHIIAPLPYMWDGTHRPLSAVKLLKEKQKEINKIRQIAIQHADKITNNAWISEKGSIQNKEKFKKELNTVNGIAEYIGGEEARKPTPVEPQQIPNSFYQLLIDYKTEFEFLSGVTSHLMGAVTSGEEPYRLALARDEFSTRRLRSWITSTFEPWLEVVGNIFNEVAKVTYTKHKVFRITQPETGEEKQFEMNIPIFDDKSNIINRIFDFQTTEFDVSVKHNSTLPTNKDAIEEKLFRLYKEQVIDDIYYLKKTEMPDVNSLLQRKSIYSNQQKTIENLEKEIKSLLGDIETLRRQLLQSDLKYEQTKNSTKEKEALLETEKNLKILSEVEKLRSKLLEKEQTIETIKEKHKNNSNEKKSKESENKS